MTKKGITMVELAPTVLWLIKQEFGKACNPSHWIGPVNNKTNRTAFVLEDESGKCVLFLPYTAFDVINGKKSYHQAALEDETIFKCIFILPVILNEKQNEVLNKTFETAKETEVWDAPLFEEKLQKHLNTTEKLLGSTVLNVERANELIDENTLKNNDKDKPPKLLTNHGNSLNNLIKRFSFEKSIRILQESKANETDDLFTLKEYSLLDVVVIAGDIKNFTQLMEIATKKRNPSSFGKKLKVWYEKIAEITEKHDGFLDKFIGDGFLIFFGYPFIDDRNRELINAYNCACEIIQTTKTVICDGITKIFDDKLEPYTGAIRIGISSGDLYTLPTSTITKTPYQQFLILGNPIVEAARIESAVKPNNIGIDSETFEELKNLIPGIDQGSKKQTVPIKKQTISFFQVEP